MELFDTASHQDWIAKDVLNRFLRYVKIFTTSDRHSGAVPSTPGQWDIARILAEELKAMGVTDVTLNDQCYIVARIPANIGSGQKAPVFGLMAHMDTAPDLSGEGVNPQVVERYDGGVIRLNDQYALDPATYPGLLQYKGQTIVTTDGTTLLGADDKAGVAEIMTAVALLQEHPEIPHGQIEIYFTPDEEIGRGMDRFPSGLAKSEFCYTLDGDEEGSIEAECFTAFKVEVEFSGMVIHLGDARGKLANAVTMAANYVSMLPRSESPEATDGRFGYYCPLEIRGDLDHAWLEVYLRDFELSEVQRRIAYLESLGKTIEASFPHSRVTVRAEKQYLNMREALDKRPEVIELLLEAIRQTGMEPKTKIIRGGTDGARFTEMGIPTPNVFAGGHNFHSRFEWVALPAMVRACRTIVNLSQLWAQPKR